MQFIDAARHRQIDRPSDGLGPVDPRPRQVEKRALAAHGKYLPGSSTIALRSGALIARAFWPRNPVQPSTGQSWRKAWPPHARAPLRPRRCQTRRARKGSRRCREPASSSRKMASAAFFAVCTALSFACCIDDGSASKRRGKVRSVGHGIFPRLRTHVTQSASGCRVCLVRF
jgi:hypothetical protein